MFLLAVPVLLVGPVMLLAAAVVGLWAHGPAGWVAAVGLVAGVLWTSRWIMRRARTWWRSTKAPDLPAAPRELRHNR